MKGGVELTKQRTTLYLTQEVLDELAEYTRSHSEHFDTTSQAAEHLLAQALRRDAKPDAAALEMERELEDKKMHAIGRSPNRR